MLSNKITALIRTWTPILAGWLLSLPIAGPVLNALGIDTATADRWATAGVGAILAAAWYGLARLLEDRWPNLGVLLGVPAKPIYALPATAASAASVLDIPDTPDPLADTPDPNTPGASAPSDPAPAAS